MKSIICRIKHMNLQIACADNLSQIVNLKAINRHILTPLFSVIYMPLFNSKAVLSRCKTARCRIDFDTYRNLQRHRAVLPAIARLLCTNV